MRLDGKTTDLTGWFESYGLPPFEPEYRFHPVRRWRFDYANKAYKVAVEINGGIWTHGRHIRGSGYIGDRAKINAAQILGWIVLEFSPQQIKTGEAFVTIRDALNARDWSSTVYAKTGKWPLSQKP